MTYLRKKEKLNYLLELINKGNCGDAAQLALSLHVSVRTIKNYLSILRQMGYYIVFDQKVGSYMIINQDIPHEL
ncbi:MAG: HTH domain-containing protein [Bacteroidales bacterium]|jgi:predicted DNA-binding transcriptional regulator YafY|nr:HTH domain-containing protein [Bacteroidales bacterium]